MRLSLVRRTAQSIVRVHGKRRTALPSLIVVALAAASASVLPVATASGATPVSIWPSNPTPSVQASGDASANELGVKFKSDVGGTVTGIRFYKGAGNTGTHVGHLWSATGNLLASATFTNETSTGWQTVLFATPVTVTANTVYVASYYAPNGHYADNVGYFTSTGANSPPLHALQSGVSGANGVYSYRASAYPTSSYNSSNYWVDVTFVPATTSDTTAPSVPTGLSATAVSPTQVNVSWSASTDNVGVAGYTVSRNGVVIATVTSTSYADTSVAASTSYSYTVKAFDAAGNTSAASAPATVTTPSSTTCTGVNVPSGASIQAAINAYAGGTTFCISGTHSISSAIVPKSGDKLIGAAGSLIDGGGASTVAINGNGATGVTIKGLKVEHFNTAGQVAAVANGSGTGWDIENNEVAYNTHEGIHAGDHSIVKNNHVHDNGQLGITGYQANYAVVSGNEVDHNGATQYVQFEGGGMKFFEGTNVTISGNYVHDNDGSGIWLDTDVVNSTVTGNRLSDNADGTYPGHNIEIEITCNDTVSNNTVTGTGKSYSGIWISSSHNVNVTGNSVSGAVNGIRLWMDSTRTTQAICGAPSINNDTVSSNSVTLAAGSSHTDGVYVYHGGAPSGVAFRSNIYHASDCGAAHWQWYFTSNLNYTFPQWTSSGGGMPDEDTTGSCGP